jgi:hypothetical protein
MKGTDAGDTVSWCANASPDRTIFVPKLAYTVRELKSAAKKERSEPKPGIEVHVTPSSVLFENVE